MQPEELKRNVTVYDPFFPEPIEVIPAQPMGSSIKLIGKGIRSRTVYESILNAEQISQLRSANDEKARAIFIAPCRLLT